MNDAADWIGWEWAIMFGIVLAIALRELWSVRRK